MRAVSIRARSSRNASWFFIGSHSYREASLVCSEKVEYTVKNIGNSSVRVSEGRKLSYALVLATMSTFANFVARYLPSVRASDSELVDPQKVIREKCHKLPNCSALHEKLNTCNDRVNSRKKTEETCTEELFDYMHCVDHCAAKTLFSKLK